MRSLHTKPIVCRGCGYETQAKRSDALCNNCSVTSKSIAQKNWHGQEKNKAIKRNTSRKAYEELRQWYWDLKNNPCTDCHKSFHPVSMQFDHVRGKVANISKLLTYKAERAKRLVTEEIEKCDLVCANCHFYREHCRNLYMDGF